MRGGKGILGMYLWRSGLLLIALPCMMVIWGPYKASAMLMMSVVIQQFQMWFLSFKVCVDGYPTSFCSIVALSYPLIYCVSIYRVDKDVVCGLVF